MQLRFKDFLWVDNRLNYFSAQGKRPYAISSTTKRTNSPRLSEATQGMDRIKATDREPTDHQH